MRMEEIHKQRERGRSLQTIAEDYGVSKQRIKQLLDNDYQRQANIRANEVSEVVGYNYSYANQNKVNRLLKAFQKEEIDTFEKLGKLSKNRLLSIYRLGRGSIELLKNNLIATGNSEVADKIFGKCKTCGK